MDTEPQESWGGAAAYERFVGRWSRRVAPVFLAQLPLAPGLIWADVGCGTGALTQSILARCAPGQVVGIDQAEGFVAAARDEISDPRAVFQQGNALALPLRDAAVDATVSGLVLNFVPDHAGMVREMKRVTRPGGTVAAYVWDYAGGMELLRLFWDAAVRLRPQDASLDEAQRFPVCEPQALRALWLAQGLEWVQTQPLEIDTIFQNFDDFWTPFLGRMGPAPTYLALLGEAEQASIREALRDRLRAYDGGPIMLRARAWAVQGRVPLS
ncbi:class I SAM-dependent methyltransferase [Deinococcus arcticus]|uniref:SAM-dependent methyltransferase n=1 Tax=Deinococcus arcticus TaxID=2136176 RepID=A0A2T3W6H3_9DEIO|nr:class I SAM-dependent methyltransferase [Deinococcus arcticus]PTA67353.1 SAM-dependent methyltransferase [Deinococcus arcticus]